MQKHNYIYELTALFFSVSVITSIRQFIGSETVFMLRYLVSFCFIVASFFTIKKDIKFVSGLYCFAIILGFVFHKINGVTSAHLNEVVIHIIPVIIIIHYNNIRYSDNRLIRAFALTFFVLECILGIYEKITLTPLINYISESQAMNTTMEDSSSFRSFSLLGHPLENANIVSIFLAFILCSNRIPIIPKIFYVALGLLGLWSFNSRASIMIWLIILLYRFFLYNLRLKWIIIDFIIIFLFIVYFPIILSYYKSGLLGRFDFDFSDGSSLTRILAYEIFLSHSWSLDEVLLGGTILYQPVANRFINDVPIENGILLDLSYWGGIWGPIKIMGEIIITYLALFRFHIKDRIIIMMSLWAVAFMNNNSFYTFLLPFFMCALLSFGTNQESVNTNKKMSENKTVKNILKQKKLCYYQ